MPRKKRQPRKTSMKRGSKSFWRSLTALLLVITIIAGLYVIVLDVRLKEKMSGRIWALPSQVFARPLELYAGLSLQASHLESELVLTGYNRVNAIPAVAGQYRQWDNQHFEIITRDFRFGDGYQKGGAIRVDFSDDKVEGVFSLFGNDELALVRLEPVRIAGIYPGVAEDRKLIRLSEAPENLVLTLLAVEDRRFYEHYGVDPRAIARAIWNNLTSSDAMQGGSTLTQQLVKNLFLDSERSLIRKFNEAIMALLLEYHYDKSTILETYLNEIYLGQDGARGIHGFALASEFYFDKSLNQLSRDQLAMLVGLVKGASWYDPRRHPERALQRRNQVLQQMADQSVINASQLKTLQARPLAVSARAHRSSNRYPAFIDLVKRQLQADYNEEDLHSEGLRIFTTLDPMIQRAAEQSVLKILPELEKQNAKSSDLQTAVIVAAPDNGDIQALVSDRDPLSAGYNRALDASRQIGSLVKPAVYLAALQQPEKYTVASILDDAPLSLKERNGRVWSPKNYDGKYLEKIPLYRALEDSRNIPAVRLGLDVGLGRIASTLEDMGVEREVPAYPSLMLGAFNLTPFEVTRMYQSLAGKGFKIPLRAIREVTTEQGEMLTRYPIQVKQTLKMEDVYLLNRVLHLVTQTGTARSLATSLPVQVAGKTGTTDDLRDSWFAGYADNRMAVVWVGRDDNAPTGLTGSSGALRIWTNLMQHVPLEDLHLDLPDTLE
ncbi:MAG TPA: penicillin-binding protein 1B, partial [Gammaproteobacteria bacterium]|nr:penicillin-binding protein 1B [Gammaproteobacteria bacterium]